MLAYIVLSPSWPSAGTPAHCAQVAAKSLRWVGHGSAAGWRREVSGRNGWRLIEEEQLERADARYVVVFRRVQCVWLLIICHIWTALQAPKFISRSHGTCEHSQPSNRDYTGDRECTFTNKQGCSEQFSSLLLVSTAAAGWSGRRLPQSKNASTCLFTVQLHLWSSSSIHVGHPSLD